MTEEEVDAILIPAILAQAEAESVDAEKEPDTIFVLREKYIDKDNVKRELVEVPNV